METGKLTSKIVEFDSTSVNIDNVGGNLTFTDVSNPSGKTLSNLTSPTVAHNSTTGIQGGSGIDGYLHLTSTQHTWIIDGTDYGYWRETKGGTGNITYLFGDILYANATNTLDKLSATTDGYMLELVSGAPAWREPNKIMTQILVGKPQALSTNTDGYLLPSFSESSDENFPAYVANTDIILKNLTVTMSDNNLGGVENAVVTVRKNHVDTSLSVTLDESTPLNDAGTLYIVQDKVNSILANNGDKITVRFINSNTVINNIMANFDIWRYTEIPVPWTPASLGSILEADWNCDDGITLETGRISSWGDQSGFNHNAIQAVSGKRPALDSGKVINGHTPIRFNYLNGECLSLSTPISGLSAGHMFVIFRVVNDPALGNTDSGAWNFGSYTSNTLIPYSDGNIYDSFGASSRYTTGNPSPSLSSQARCYEAISVASRWENRIDGATHYNSGAANTVSWAASQFIGQSYQNTVFFNGWIWRMIICNQELTGSDLTSMRNYLSSTYNITFA